LQPDETAALEHLSRTTSARLDQVQRARALLAVAAGDSFQAAARRAGFRSGYGVAKLVARFNRTGLAALEIAPGRGRKVTYDSRVRRRVLATVRQPPDRARDGTATWSLQTLQTHLRTAPEGLPTLGATTIRRFLHEAGYTYQRTRTWCPTGTAQRVRKDGVVTVYDEATEEKKDSSS
jgi:transposase